MHIYFTSIFKDVKQKATSLKIRIYNKHGINTLFPTFPL